MEIKTEYQYGLGRFNDILRGKLKNLVVGTNYTEVILKSKKNNSLIQQIELMGIYQKVNSKINQGFDSNLIDTNSEEVESPLDNLMGLSKIIIESESGIIDKIHPRLIQIAYDSDNLNKNVLKDFINDKLSRIKIVPYNELESLDKKDYIKDLIFQLSRRTEIDDFDGYMEKRIEDGISLLDEKLDKQGLTRGEYAMLLLFKRKKDIINNGYKKEENRIIKSGFYFDLFLNELKKNKESQDI